MNKKQIESVNKFCDWVNQTYPESYTVCGTSFDKNLLIVYVYPQSVYKNIQYIEAEYNFTDVFERESYPTELLFVSKWELSQIQNIIFAQGKEPKARYTPVPNPLNIL